jgi:hypothetical protein
MSRLIHRITIETGCGKGFPQTKQHFFRAAGSMREHRLTTRTRRCGKNSKRRRVGRQHYFFNANARLNYV